MKRTIKTIKMKCNLCGGNSFIDFHSRELARCKKCNSLERTRLLWMYIDNLDLNENTKVLHIAPELGIYKALKNRVSKDNYIVGDLFPKKYAFAENCIAIDLCNLDDEKSFQYDLIIHSHVMEHIPCNIAYTLYHLHRMLKKNGKHVSVIPFAPGKYDECFQDISDDERKRRFGQSDHVRRFGREDIKSHLGSVINLPEEFNALDSFSENKLREANIPEKYWKGFGVSTVLSLNRNDMRFIEDR